MKKALTLGYLITLFACNETTQAQKSIDSSKGLKDYYKNYFPIGVAVMPSNLKGDEADHILRQFNSLTPENSMKMGPIHPEGNRYNWADADSIVAFAQRNGLKVRGHALCWHNQTPPWLFKDSSGNGIAKEVLLKRLKEHITTVVSRYKGKVYACCDSIVHRKESCLNCRR